MRRTVLEVLHDFPHLNVPVEYLLDVFPHITPRSFSISSNYAVHRNTLQLTVGIVEYRTRMATLRTGLATQWLKSLEPGTKVAIHLKPGTMELPETGVPTIFVGPGLGVAPMRSMLYERLSLGHMDNILVFGCRNKYKDDYYAQEFKDMSHLKYWTAYSRDTPQKVYVQHRLLEHGARVWRTIHHQGGYVYLSGSATAIPRDVTQALEQIASKYGNMSPSDARDYVLQLRRTGRFQMECWS
jgi:sulfite reductase alpha subunit-like flavoprotein